VHIWRRFSVSAVHAGACGLLAVSMFSSNTRAQGGDAGPGRKTIEITATDKVGKPTRLRCYGPRRWQNRPRSRRA